MLNSSSPQATTKYWINSKPYHILWGGIPMIFLTIAITPEKTFDLQLHDSYFVISSIHMALFVSIYLILLGTIYWLVKKYKTVSILNTIHSTVTVFGLLSISIIIFVETINPANAIRGFTLLNSIGMVIFALIILVQLIFIINLTIGIIRGK